MTGRKRMPTTLKILRAGGKEAVKLAKKQIPTPGDLMSPPDWFSADQKTAWKYAIENAPRGVLKRIDKAVLAAFIVAEDVHQKASVAMQQTTLLVKSPKQELPMQNPYLPIVNRQYQLMLRGASELGFTPCSRARIESGNAPMSPAGDWENVESA
jgi:P27 family predicted phage terminase small subunit